jgi:hypothetical protein
MRRPSQVKQSLFFGSTRFFRGHPGKVLNQSARTPCPWQRPVSLRVLSASSCSLGRWSSGRCKLATYRKPSRQASIRTLSGEFAACMYAFENRVALQSLTLARGQACMSQSLARDGKVSHSAPIRTIPHTLYRMALWPSSLQPPAQLVSSHTRAAYILRL